MARLRDVAALLSAAEELLECRLPVSHILREEENAPVSLSATILVFLGLGNGMFAFCNAFAVTGFIRRQRTQEWPVKFGLPQALAQSRATANAEKLRVPVSRDACHRLD